MSEMQKRQSRDEHVGHDHRDLNLMKRAEHARHDRVLAHCSKKVKTYMINTRPDALRRAFIDNDDAASRVTRPGTGYYSPPASWLKDAIHSRADTERSVL
jgi:hypothetical protein